MYIQTKEPGAVSLWAFLHFVVLLRTDRGGPQQRIGNISRPAAAETCPPSRAKMEKGRFRMYDRKCDVDIRLLGCALVLLVMALLTIHTGLARKAVTAAADPAPAAVVSTQDTRLSEDAGSVRYGCIHVENLLPVSAKEKAHLLLKVSHVKIDIAFTAEMMYPYEERHTQDVQVFYMGMVKW